MFLRLFFIIGCGLSVSGCVSIQSTALSDLKATRGQKVPAAVDGFGWFRLWIPDEITADSARDQLLTQCSDGDLTGVGTTMSTRDFLILQHYDIQASAFCTK